MKAEEAVVSAVLASILALLAWIAGTAFSSDGAPLIEVFLLCAAIILAGVAFGGVIRLLPKAGAVVCFILAAVALALLLVLHYRLIAVCGDSVCDSGECRSCAKDCSPSACIDGACEQPLERCDNSYDCKCSVIQACAPGRNTSDERGCAPISCGDGLCDVSENAENCCADCGCQEWFSCVRNSCVFTQPKVRFSSYLLTNNISVASLAGNPMLTNASGSSRPLMGLRISSTGYVKNMTVTFSIPGVLSNTVDAGFLRPDDELPVLWYVRPDPRLLAVTEDWRTNVTIIIRYLDAQNERHTSSWQVPITLLGRGTLDSYGHPVIFATRDIVTRAKTPDGIWDELGRSVVLSNRTGGTLFPFETLSAGKGSQRDIAVLLASAYDAAGLRPSLVEGNAGLAADASQNYVRVRWKDAYVLLDPRRIGEPFEQAIISAPGFALYDLQKVRGELNLTIVSLNKSFIPGGDVTTVTHLEQWCVADNGARAVALHTIANNGLVPARVCAVSVISALAPDTRRMCATIAPGSSMEFRHGWQGASCEKVTAGVRIEPAQ